MSRAAARITDFAERWVPDAFIFALLATAVTLVAAVAVEKRPLLEVVDLWGGGFWELLSFTLQMALVIITGAVLAATRPVAKAIRALAHWPRTPRQAVAMVAVFAMASSWFNWGFSLIFSAMLARELARRMPEVDYRALAASAFLGLGSVWAQGLSGSAALQMATASALPAAIRKVVEANGAVPGGIIPLTHTIFLWQSLLSVAVELVVVTAVMAWVTPVGARARTAAQLGIALPGEENGDDRQSAPSGASEIEGHGRLPRRGWGLGAGGAPKVITPGEWLEHSPLLTIFFVTLSGTYLVRVFTSGGGLNALNLNVVNLAFLTLGAALHGTPARLMRAFKEATPGTWGVLLQFPLYAGIAAVISKTHLNEAIAGLFVRASTPATFPALIGAYSLVLGIFVPSGGSKWVIEAPYVMAAAHSMHAHLGWMVAVYDLGEALANLVQPFWMLPVLGVFGLRARDVMGFTAIVFLVLVPIVLVLVTLLATTLSYPL